MLLVDVWNDRFFVGCSAADVVQVKTADGIEQERIKRGIRSEAVFVDEAFRPAEIREICKKYGYNPVRHWKNPVARLIDELIQ